MPGRVDMLVALVVCGAGGPALIWAGYRHWRGAAPARPSRNRRAATTGQGPYSVAAGRRAFLPAGVAATLMAVGLLLILLEGPHIKTAPVWVRVVLAGSFMSGVAVLVVAEFIWAFNRPRFLVPPQFRQEQGWVVHSWARRRMR